jgi:hypothetical protein
MANVTTRIFGFTKSALVTLHSFRERQRFFFIIIRQIFINLNEIFGILVLKRETRRL